MQLMAVLPMAVPGMVLGLGYIMFFNHPANPLTSSTATMAILVIVTVVALLHLEPPDRGHRAKQIDNEFEAVSASLKVPFYKTFFRVTVPVCLPAVLDIGRYYFVDLDGHAVRRGVPVLARTRYWRRSRS